ncbi:MAG: hypothetical protein IRZ08_20625, partial [Frankia sp.]|nr:hypothetical protein [Frankia sp.]
MARARPGTTRSSALGTFTHVIARGLASLRVLGIVLTAAYVAIWWDDFYRDHPGHLAALATLTGWTVAGVVVNIRCGVPMRFAVADVVVGVAAGLGAPWAVPPQSHGDPSSPAFFAVQLASMCSVCALRTRWSIAALVMLAASLYIPARDHYPQSLTSTALLLFVGMAIRQAVVRLRRVAIAADDWLAAVGDLARHETVAAARARAERAQERFLHDTALNMLAGIGMGGADDSEQTRARCRRTVAEVEQMLAGAEPVDLPGGEDGVGAAAGQVAQDWDDELRRRLTAVVAEARADGLVVTLHFEGPDQPCPAGAGRATSHEEAAETAEPAGGAENGSAGRARGGADEPTRLEPLPPEIVTAVAAAAREALVNVRRHASASAAQVSVHRAADKLLVRIADDGVGFDPSRFDPSSAVPPGVAPAIVDDAGAGWVPPPRAGSGQPDRGQPDRPRPLPAYYRGPSGRRTAGEPDRVPLGLSGSVYGRMLDAGGWAQIDSARGRGTRVDLHWRAPRSTTTRSADAASLTRDYETATRRGIGAAMVAGAVCLAVPALAYRHRVDPSLDLLAPIASVAPLLLWAAFAAGVARIVCVTWRRPLTRWEALGTTGFAVGVLLGGAATSTGGDFVRIYNWAGLVANLLLLPVTASRPTREWVAAATITTGTMAALGLPRIGDEPIDQVRLLAMLVAPWAIQLLVRAAGPALRASAATTTMAAATEARLAAAQAAATAVRRDRARRLARLDRDVLPLLRAIADGESDPRDERVRRLCENRARALRRMLVGSGGRAGPLAELETAIDAAEARGVRIVLQVAGDFAAVPPDVRDEVIDVVSDALRTVPPGPVTVTILCDGPSVRCYISFPATGPSVVLPLVPWPAGAAWTPPPTPADLAAGAPAAAADAPGCYK